MDAAPSRSLPVSALIASIVSVIAIIVLRELAPWRKKEDDIVAYTGYWLVFSWLFALLAYDALEKLPGWVWGTPLTLLTIAFVALAFKKGWDENAAAARPVPIESDDVVLGDSTLLRRTRSDRVQLTATTTCT